MAHDLIRHYLGPPMTAGDVESLLGPRDKTWPPDAYSPALPHDVYEYDMGRAPMDFQDYKLRLFFDGKGHYRSAEIGRD